MFVSVLISQIRTGLELVNIKCTHNGFVLYMYCKSVLSSLITEFTDNMVPLHINEFASSS